MTERTVMVNNSSEDMITGRIVQLASRFSSTIRLSIDDKTINAKSIMGVMALGELEGHQMTITGDGADEVNAVNEIVNFLK